MKYYANYKCRDCHATKRLVWDTERVGNVPGTKDISTTVICGVQGCGGVQILVEVKKKNITVENIPTVKLDPDFTPK